MHLSLRMNRVHVSIADPFIHFPNELPLAYLHSELNMMLLSLDTPWPRDAAHYSKLQSRTQQEHEAGDPPAAASPDGGKRVQQSSGRAGSLGRRMLSSKSRRRRHLLAVLLGALLGTP